MYVQSVVILLSALASFTTALRCWTCENAKSPGQCIEFGRSKLCKKTEKVCQTELRFSLGWGKAPTIRTGCKEQHACGNNHVQNPRKAWSPTQCNRGTRNSVCRCCCRSINCNENDLLCESVFGNIPGPLNELVCSKRPKAPGNGTVACQKSRYPGSQCRYFCKRGYLLVGNTISTCTGFGDIAMWTGATPICRRQPVCDEILPPKGGKVRCFGSGEVGSYCTFSCNERLRIEGASAVTCMMTKSGPAWSDKPPTCEAARCDFVGKLPRGNVSCSSPRNELGTVCRFSCTVGDLMLAPTDTDNTVCVWRKGRATWNRRKPCCSAVVCPPSAKKDIVIAIDSSGSIKSHEWVRMKSFVINVLGKFHISASNVRIAMFRFNQFVDTKNQISFGDHDSIEELTVAIDNMPKDGQGTHIGNALRYTRDQVLKHKNRPDVSDMLWVLTDGKSNDEFKTVATELRESGVEIIALGISRKGGKDFMQQLIDLTGDRDLVLEVADVIGSFADDLVQLVTSKICEVNCVE